MYSIKNQEHALPKTTTKLREDNFLFWLLHPFQRKFTIAIQA
jgi:hypothetical protein